MTNLDAFLKEQGNGLFDSSGEFTIAADKALKKLAHCQLPNPSYWILKMMQFATSWEALAGEVSFGRRISRVELDLPHPVSVQQIQKGLGAVDPLPDPGLESLVTALRAAGAMEGRRFVLILRSPKRLEHLFWNGKRLSLKESDEPSDGTSLTLEITSSDPSTWSKMVDVLAVGRRVAELELLSKKAFTLPFPLLVDGRMPELDYFKLPKKFRQPVLCDFSHHETGFTLPHLISGLVRSTIDGPGGTALRQKFSQTPWRASAFWNISYNYTVNHKALRVTPSPVTVDGLSKLHWLRDGVIVEVERIKSVPREFSVDVFVDASDCEADLGGLKIRKTEHFRTKREWVQKLLNQIVEATNRAIPTATALTGEVMGGWDSFVIGTTHMPLVTSVKYQRPSMVGKPLSETVGFREKLFHQIRGSEILSLSLTSTNPQL